MGVFSIGKVVVGSLFKKPSTLMYPVIPREWEERTRGAVGIDADHCILCGACARACPTGAIVADRKAGEWAIERMNCVQCSACVDNCPPGCLTMENKYTEPGGEKVVDRFVIPKKEKPAKKNEAMDQAKKAAKEAVAGAEAPAAEEDGDGPLTCDTETCVYCGLCAKACPVDALEVTRKPDKTWKVDADECIRCGACIDKCPKDSLSFGSASAPSPVEEKEDAAASAAESAPAEDDKDKNASADEALKADEVDPKVTEYLQAVRASLQKDFGLAEADADKAMERAELASQLKAFPYLMNNPAKETAEKLK